MRGRASCARPSAPSRSAHAEAVAAFTAQNRITREDIDIVGFHGQTVLHRPEQRLTVQIGDARGAGQSDPYPRDA